MPGWLNVILGVLAGAVVIGGAIYVAVRPYLGDRPPKSWLPEPREGRSGGDYSGGADPGGGAI